MLTLLQRLKDKKIILPSSKQLKQELARRNLLNFTLQTKPDYNPNWHHKLICKTLDKFLGETDFNRLMVFAPPQHGKTELASRRLPAYAFGKNPDLAVMSCSYAADLSQMINRDVQRIIDEPNFQLFFPETKLFGANVRTVAQGNYLRNSDIFEIVGKKGIYKNAGVGGSITGMGLNLGIIDDPIKNWKEAASPTVRQAVWDWYGSTFYTRARKNAKILIILTRWHEDDLAGRLLRQMEEDPQADRWEVLSLPAIYDPNLKYIHPEDPRKPGQALWPDFKDEKALVIIKATLGSYLFNAMYQQNPSPPEGSILQRGWWQFYKERLKLFDEVIQSWDCSFKDTKTSSYVVGQVWGRIEANKYLLDQVREKMDFPATIQAIKNLSSKWLAARTVLVEDKANGPAVISTLKNEISGIIPVNPEGGKVVRAQAVSPDIEAGNVFLPAPAIAPWIHDFIEECAAFPNAANDDQVDAMTQALSRLYSRATSIPKVTSTPREEDYGYADYGFSQRFDY